MDELLALDSLEFIPVPLPSEVTYPSLLSTLQQQLSNTALLSQLGQVSALGDATENIELANQAERNFSRAKQRAETAMEQASEFEKMGDVIRALKKTPRSEMSGDRFARDMLNALQGATSFLDKDPRSRDALEMNNVLLPGSFMSNIGTLGSGFSNLDLASALKGVASIPGLSQYPASTDTVLGAMV